MTGLGRTRVRNASVAGRRTPRARWRVPESSLPELAGVIVLGLLAQWIAWRIALPSILLLLLFGLLAGPVFDWLAPDTLFGDLLTPTVSLSVALILYEGGLTLRLSELPKLVFAISGM